MRNSRLRILRFLIGFLPLVAAALGIPLLASAQNRSIETPNVTLQLSEGTGDLVGLHWKDPNLEVIGDPRLGENFRLLVPQVGYEAAYFNSRDQHVSRIQASRMGWSALTIRSAMNRRESRLKCAIRSVF